MCCIFIMLVYYCCHYVFFFQAEDGIRDKLVTGVQTCALPIFAALAIGGSAHLNRLHAQPRQHRGVRLKVSLNRQNPNLHFAAPNLVTNPASKACPSLPSAARPALAWLHPALRELRAQPSDLRNASPLSQPLSRAFRDRWT